MDSPCQWTAGLSDPGPDHGHDCASQRRHGLGYGRCICCNSRSTTGRLVSRDVICRPTTYPAPFTVGFDAALINPADTYVAAAAVIDGATLYQTKSTTPVTPGATFDLVTGQSSTTIPIPGASASPGASETAGRLRDPGCE